MLFQGLYHSNRCAVGRQFLLHLSRQPREARNAKETVARDEVVDNCLVDAVALHVDSAEDDGRLHSPDLVDAFAKDFGVDIVSSRDHALANELLEHLDVFQVSAVQNGGVDSSGVVSDGQHRAEFQPLASRAATVQHFRAGVCGEKCDSAWSRRGRVNLHPHEGGNRLELA